MPRENCGDFGGLSSNVSLIHSTRCQHASFLAACSRRWTKEDAPVPEPTSLMQTRVARLVGRLQAAGVGDDLRALCRIALTHVGNGGDAAHEFLCDIGLTADNAPGRRRALFLTDQVPMTFGLSADGEQCDESDLAP
jgi:hypothetical protein